MASITREPNGRRTIQFVTADGKRKSIRLGKVSQRDAERIKLKIEFLAAAAAARLPLDSETAEWVAGIGEDLAGKLASAGLIPARKTAQETKLGPFLNALILRRTDGKPNTIRTLEACRNRLSE